MQINPFDHQWQKKDNKNDVTVNSIRPPQQNIWQSGLKQNDIVGNGFQNRVIMFIL